MTDILLHLKKLAFADQDLRKFPKLNMSRYMTSVQVVKGGPIQLVPMEWTQGLEKLGILLLMHMHILVALQKSIHVSKNY